jgi:4'-phosphopantetheinyl transferase EntD
MKRTCLLPRFAAPLRSRERPLPVRCVATERHCSRAETARLAIAGLYPDGVIVEVAAPGEVAGELHPLEAAFIAGAAPKRRSEFATGRQLARNALARLDVHDTPLLPDADRAPRWPAGIVGSLSHTVELCAVAVQRSCALQSIGLDLEPAEGLPPEIQSHVLTGPEHAALRAKTRNAAEMALMGRLVFSAKECFYKCQYPLTRRFLDFHDVELELDLERQSFLARPAVDLGLSERTQFAGRWQQDSGHWMTAMALPAAEKTIDG